MRSLSLHVGHGKTGSSYLQSVLAHARQPLLDAGINYPTHNSLKDARAGKVTSGNGIRLMDAVIAQESDPVWFNHADHVLFSSEFLFDFFIDKKNHAAIRSFLDGARIEKIRILLFIRDPIEQVTSSYQQFIKRGGGTLSADEFSRRFIMPERVMEFLEFTDRHDDIEVVIRNYSRTRGDLARVLFDTFEIEPVEVTLPTRAVNRSLTRAEFALQKSFNSVLGKSGELVADPLCNSIPDAVPCKIIPGLEAQKFLLERSGPAMAAINARLPKEEHYRLEPIEKQENDDPQIQFTEREIDVFGTSIATEIRKLRKKARRLEAALKEAGIDLPDK